MRTRWTTSFIGLSSNNQGQQPKGHEPDRHLTRVDGNGIENGRVGRREYGESSQLDTTPLRGDSEEGR